MIVPVFMLKLTVLSLLAHLVMANNPPMFMTQS